MWRWFWLSVCMMSVCRASAPVYQRLSALDAEVGSPRMEVECFLDAMPMRGEVPVRVRVYNPRVKEGTWGLRFQGVDGYGREGMTSFWRLEVEPGAERTVEWMVPVAPGGGWRGGWRLEVLVSGDGVAAQAATLMSGSGGGGRGPKAFVGLSEAVSLAHREVLEQELRQRGDVGGMGVRLARASLGMLPEDPRGLSGVDALVVTEMELRGLGAGQRRSLRQWQVSGGLLLVEGGGKEEEVGFGGEGRIHLAGSAAKGEELMGALLRRGSLAKEFMTENAYGGEVWALRREVPDVGRPVGLLMLATLAIAAVLGPMNFLYAHRKGRPAVLLYSTPILSVGLSLFLMGAIVVGDGFGGWGHRSLVVFLFPEEKTEWVWQEQVTRTGVLLDDGFRLPVGISMVPVEAEAARPKRRRGRGEEEERYERSSAGEMGGGWFRSRRVQAQVLWGGRPSRAELRFSGGGTPEVMSSVDAELRDVMVVDREGVVWHTDRVGPGETQGLRALTGEEARDRLRRIAPRDSGRFAALCGGRAPAGWFFARGEEGEGFMPTLEGIRWKKQPVVWAGHWTEGARP